MIVCVLLINFVFTSLGLCCNTFVVSHREHETNYSGGWQDISLIKDINNSSVNADRLQSTFYSNHRNEIFPFIAELGGGGGMSLFWSRIVTLVSLRHAKHTKEGKQHDSL